VIYSVGMLLEGDYKSLVQGKFDASKVLELLRQNKTRSPLEANPLHPRGYDAVNRDGGKIPWKYVHGSNSCRK
jgi:hypothetical protein